jgi:hypothetical protein
MTFALAFAAGFLSGMALLVAASVIVCYAITREEL